MRTGRDLYLYTVCILKLNKKVIRTAGWNTPESGLGLIRELADLDHRTCRAQRFQIRNIRLRGLRDIIDGNFQEKMRLNCRARGFDKKCGPPDRVSSGVNHFNRYIRKKLVFHPVDSH